MLTYLATPYTHDDPAIRQQRFDDVTKVAARLMLEGHLIYSPISHTHYMAVHHELPNEWEFWKSHCETFLAVSRLVIVLKLDGWRESVGVAAEIEIAETMGIDVEYMELEQSGKSAE